MGLVATTFMYDELGAASHIIGKNFCNIGGYASFEIGATTIIGMSSRASFLELRMLMRIRR
jgi:hypothetical protein